MDEETKTEQPQDKEPTVNAYKFERMKDRAEAAEAKIADLQKQLDEATARTGTDAEAIKAMQEAAAKAAEEAKAKAEDYEQQIATAERTNELLKAGCIDTESGLASLHEGMTIDQLKDTKPHLFKQETKPSGGDPKDPAVSPEEELVAKMRSKLGL